VTLRGLPALAAAGLGVALAGCCLCKIGVTEPGAALEPAAAEPAASAAVPETYVVVVPGRNGHIGGVVLNSGTPEQIVLDTAYAAAHVDHGGKSARVASPPPEEVASMFADVAQARPEPPVSFVVYFNMAHDEFSGDSAAVMKEVYAEIGRRPNAEVTVIGHTDRVGTVENNDALSSRRALRVRDYLIKHGVTADTISTAGRGEREPLVPTEDEVSEPKNRCVEINVR
jgi:OOP family OmpA-OmpF porin